MKYREISRTLAKLTFKYNIQLFRSSLNLPIDRIHPIYKKFEDNWIGYDWHIREEDFDKFPKLYSVFYSD